MYINGARAIGLLGFLFAGFGAFLPWVSVGAFSRPGTDGDGVIVLVLAGLGAICILTGSGIFSALFALGICGVGGYDAVNITERTRAVNELQTLVQIHASIGSGIVLTMVGGVIAFGASFGAKSGPSRFACRSCGDRTNDLRVMSPTSYRCSTALCESAWSHFSSYRPPSLALGALY